jgi:hypothetical protein
MRANPLFVSARRFCLYILSVVLAVIAQAQSNIVFNGGFENTGDGWEYYPGLEIYYNQGAPEGRIHVGAIDYLYQDLATVPGRDYVLTFASQDFRRPGILWNNTAVTSLTNFVNYGSVWKYFYAYVHADSNTTRLRFNGGLLDDVKVGWLQEPIAILAQPESHSAFEGGTVSFSVIPSGAPPLSYQWFFNGQPIADAKAPTFTATGLRSSHSGQYVVAISNAWNSITSDVAQLEVLPLPTSPVIVGQPAGDLWPLGYAYSLGVFAVGAPVLQYQWFLNGQPLTGATNAVLMFSAIQATNAGTYSVLVSNDQGSILSLPAVLNVTNWIGGGNIIINGPSNNAPVFDVDGVTRLAGTNFKAQVYASASPDILRPVGAVRTFGTGSSAGDIGTFSRQIPDVSAGGTAYIQLRAWEAAFGVSYEQARALGGKFGASAIYPTVIGPNKTLRPLSFSLRVGDPFFVTGRLSPGETLPDGTQQFVLMGQRAGRYLIESQQPPNNWVPFLVLTNTTGTSVFTDTNQSSGSVHFYRARLLD